MYIHNIHTIQHPNRCFFQIQLKSIGQFNRQYWGKLWWHNILFYCHLFLLTYFIVFVFVCVCVCVIVCCFCVLFIKYLNTDMCIILLVYRTLTGEVVDIKFNQFKNESKFIVFMFVSTCSSSIQFCCVFCAVETLFFMLHIYYVI